MKEILKLLLAAIVALGFVGAAGAQERRGTADEAQAMAKKAVAYVKANGKDKAIAAFNDSKGEFIKGDLYVFMFTMDGVAVAHGQNPKMVGKNLIDMKSGDTLLIREFIKIAKGPGSGWFSYKWPNSITKAMEDKSSYIERVDDHFIGVGVYK